MIYWKRLSHTEQDTIITNALKDNIDYTTQPCLGIPASKLDSYVFHEQASFLKDAPLLRAYVQNPNHIGCHTLGESEPFFKGTQELEKEVIELLSVDLLKAAPQSCDGYIASGGTEANLQAAWIYRNYFIRQYGAAQHQIALLGSEDTHYSIAKAANILNLAWYSAAVHPDTRQVLEPQLNQTILQAQAAGIKYIIVISNMATTMFGSVDNPDTYAAALQAHSLQYKIHADGAFGGFIVPVSDAGSNVNFANPHISSVTLDAHKLLQAPYGTGIFLARKDLMQYVYTKEAQYVNGMDITLCGSRSGANAIAVWMILFTYGPFGWLEKINKLLYRTDWCCKALDKLGKTYYRNPKMNIITIRAAGIPAHIARKHGLVPDSHHHPAWYKIVVMDHVELYQLENFINDLAAHTPAL